MTGARALLIAPRAARQMREARRWWVETRPKAPLAFIEEFRCELSSATHEATESTGNGERSAPDGELGSFSAVRNGKSKARRGVFVPARNEPENSHRIRTATPTFGHSKRSEKLELVHSKARELDLDHESGGDRSSDQKNHYRSRYLYMS